MASFEIGAVVQLASGGPSMTVTGRYDGKNSGGELNGVLQMCRCMFFADHRMNEVLVPELALKAVE